MIAAASQLCSLHQQCSVITTWRFHVFSPRATIFSSAAGDAVMRSIGWNSTQLALDLAGAREPRTFWPLSPVASAAGQLTED